MPLVNVSELMLDPDFSQPFLVTRKRGQWSSGRFIVNESSFVTNGILISQSSEELDLSPGGALIQGSLALWTQTQLYVTSQEGTPQDGEYLSDEVTYLNERWLIQSERDLSDYGYYKYTLVPKRAS